VSKKNIWVHTLVKNEEKYLWYAVMSVADFVDKVLLWDTGSSDKTVEIIKQIQNIKGDKVEFKEVGEVDPEEFTKVRQQMLQQTKSDWFMILDGDEVWWEKSIKEVVNTIQREGDVLESIVSPYFNVIGDVYHYQEESAGRYQIDEHHGHVNIRAMKRGIPGLHFAKPHGQQGLYDKDGTLIQQRPKRNRKFIDAPYMHFTNILRSSSRQSDLKVPKRSHKFKYEIGLTFPKDFQYPEVFSQQTPSAVASPWEKMPSRYFIRAIIETQLKKLKRKYWPWQKVGY